MRIRWTLGLASKAHTQWAATSHDTDHLLDWIGSHRFQWELVEEDGIVFIREMRGATGWFVWKMDIEKE